LTNNEYRFTLYVISGHAASARAEHDLRQVLDACLPGGFVLGVVDLAADPARAERDRIIAAPTAIRTHPSPQRRAIGDLSSVSAVSAALGLPASAG
jgi:circadian clock protein KaiB